MKDFLGIDKMIDGLKRGAEKFGSGIAKKSVKRTVLKNNLTIDAPEPYGLGKGGPDTEQMSQAPTQAENTKIGIPPAKLRQQNKLDFLKRELELVTEEPEKKLIQDEIKSLELELKAMPEGDKDGREEKSSTIGNDAAPGGGAGGASSAGAASGGSVDSSGLGYQSGEKSTTAHREDELMQSKCLACGLESPSEWSGKCEGCGTTNDQDVGGRLNSPETTDGAASIVKGTGPVKSIESTPDNDNLVGYVEGKEKQNAGHLASDTWDAAATEERAVWLELAAQDINSAPRRWTDLSQDQRIALQDAYDMPKSMNNASEEETCPGCGVDLKKHDHRSNCEMSNAAGVQKHFTFRDSNGEEETVQAVDENEAWEKLSKDFASSLSELKAMGLKLVRTNENTKNPDEQKRILDGIKTSEGLLEKYRALPKSPENDKSIKTEETVLAGLRRNLTNGDSEGDLSEIARHAEGIEHEVSELEEQGVMNCAGNCGCTEASHKPGASEPCACTCPECKAKKEEYRSSKENSEGTVKCVKCGDAMREGMVTKGQDPVCEECEMGNSNPIPIKNSGVKRGDSKYGTKK